MGLKDFREARKHMFMMVWGFGLAQEDTEGPYRGVFIWGWAVNHSCTRDGVPVWDGK